MKRTPRRAARAQQMHAAIAELIRRALPGRDASGMVLVAEFRPGLPWIPYRWPVLGQRVRATTVWTPDNGDYGNCLWSRSSPRDTAAPLFTARQLRRLDRLVRRLETRGAFCPTPGEDLLSRDTYSWMDREPDAYPGLDRLVLTITPAPGGGLRDHRPDGYAAGGLSAQTTDSRRTDMMIGSTAARYNRNAGWGLAAGLPCIEVARTAVYGYVEPTSDGLRLVTSVHLGTPLPKMLAQDGLVPLRIVVNGHEIFDGLFPQSATTTTEAMPLEPAAARFNSAALRLPGSGWDPLGDGGAALPCLEVAGVQVYAYAEDYDAKGDRLRLVASLHLDGDIAPELLRGDLVPVRIAVNGIQVFAA